MKLLKGIFKFIIGFGCTAFFLVWILRKFMDITDLVGIIIFVFSILVGISSAISKEEDEKNK